MVPPLCLSMSRHRGTTPFYAYCIFLAHTGLPVPWKGIGPPARRWNMAQASWLGHKNQEKHAPSFSLDPGASLALPALLRPLHVQHTHSACPRLAPRHICLSAQGRRPQQSASTCLQHCRPEDPRGPPCSWVNGGPRPCKGQAHLQQRTTTHNDTHNTLGGGSARPTAPRAGEQGLANASTKGWSIHAAVEMRPARPNAFDQRRPPHAAPAPARLARAHGAC